MKLSKTAFRFAVVGLATAALYYSLLMLTVEWLSFSPMLASSICYVIVVIFNYLLHYRWTYSVDSQHAATLGRYFCMITGGFLINGLIMYLGASRADINYLLIQTGALAVVVAWNFLLSTLWVFRH